MINVALIEKYYLELIYRLILKRIAKGYTTTQLSHIIAREADFMDAIEMLQFPLKSDIELQEIAWALGEEDIRVFQPRHQEKTLLHVIMEKEVYRHTRIHSCDIIMPSRNKERPFFLLQENLTEQSRLLD
ncbi:hypothetical protein ACSBL2_06310 [Pedobacter sp. AW31-3R]|uniref:hypothetical protein n=1 Tax=Pedobacter sp. AW31-3R TaxID=3445781 RepID=UPI003FA048AA